MSTTTTTRETRPYVTSYEPAARHPVLMRIGNACMRVILRTRLGEKMQGLSILTVTGRKTGTRYEVPVSVVDFDGQPVVLMAGHWRGNLRGGADVDVRAGRETRHMRATLIEDPEQVVRVYERMLPIVGVNHANRLGLVLAGTRAPTHEELLEVIGGRRAVVELAER